MEDRELTKVERELRGYLSAQLDQVPVRSTPSFSPPPRSWIRRIAFVPATMVVILVAVGAGLGLADWRAHRATPDEAQAASGGVPGPLALAGGAPSLGFGLVSTSANTLLVRNETTEAAPVTITSALPQVAVSPNGHIIAYWLALPDRQAGKPSVYQLNLADLIVGGIASGSISRSGPLMSAPDGEVPGPFLWSSDGTGVIASTHTPVQRGPLVGAQSNPTHSSWFTIDVGSGKATELAPAFAAVVSTVYAWDRQRDLITGSGFYAGQTTFTALQGGRITNDAIPTGSMIGAADAYGHSLVLVAATACADGSPRCARLDVRDQATFAAVTTSPASERTTDYPDVMFRPRSQDLIVQIPLPNGDARVELWNDLGRGLHQVLASYSQNVRFTGRRELILPRADGSAVFLLKFDDSAGGRWFGELVSLAPNYSTRGGQDPQRTPFEIRTGGNPLASVVLDPAFARAIEPARPSSSPRPPVDRAPATPSSSVPVSGAAPVGDSAARSACDGKLGSARLVAAFESTAGVVADWVENKAYPDAPHVVSSEWRRLAPTAPAYVCYFDGQFAPPGGPYSPGASVPPLVGRALILIDSSGTQLGPSKYGPSDSIPLARPGGRF